MIVPKGYLPQYLNERRNELQELYEDMDAELASHDNKALINEAYTNVMSKLEDALSELDTLINDIDSGVYDTSDLDDDMLEVDEY